MKTPKQKGFGFNNYNWVEDWKKLNPNWTEVQISFIGSLLQDLEEVTRKNAELNDWYNTCNRLNPKINETSDGLRWVEPKVYKKYQEILDMEKDKKFQIHITPQQESDVKSAKLMEKLLNQQIDKYQGVVTVITSARRVIQDLFDRPTPISIWDRIITEVIKLEITNINLSTKDKKEER